MKTEEHKASWGHKALTECSGSENTAPLLQWTTEQDCLRRSSARKLRSLFQTSVLKEGKRQIL